MVTHTRTALFSHIPLQRSPSSDPASNTWFLSIHPRWLQSAQHRRHHQPFSRLCPEPSMALCRTPAPRASRFLPQCSLLCLQCPPSRTVPPGPKTPQQPHPSHQAAYLAACVACSWSEVLLPFTASTISSKDSGTICVGMIQSQTVSQNSKPGLPPV